MIAARKSVTFAKTVRVAIYARVSVAEGLEKEFNSIDAQREACAAYVASQRGAGWGALPERYEDGGYTGANTDRPGFQRLLADIAAGKVDAIAVYKIDRLSRSLLDFTQLLETFRRHNVAFVSVTQSFDTSTPMGRMVVSLLATFAQFERETTSERVRDKARATRRRGMWTGGRPPLGYDLIDKKLVANPAEAERVRSIFAMYGELGSLLAVVAELSARGSETKSWTCKSGKARARASIQQGDAALPAHEPALHRKGSLRGRTRSWSASGHHRSGDVGRDPGAALCQGDQSARLEASDEEWRAASRTSLVQVWVRHAPPLDTPAWAEFQLLRLLIAAQARCKCMSW